MAGNLDDIPWSAALLSSQGELRGGNRRFREQWPDIASIDGIHPDDRLGLVRAIQDLQRSEGSLDLDLRLFGGANLWTSMSVSVALCADHEPVALMIVRGPVSSLAALAHLAAEAELYQPRTDSEGEGLMAVFRHVPTPCMIFSTDDLRILDVNPAAERLYGWSSTEFRELSLLDIRPVEDIAMAASVVKTSGSSVRNTGPNSHLTRSGEIFDVEVTSVPIRVAGRVCRFAVIRDLRETQGWMRQVEVAQRTAYSILEGMADAFYALDPDLRFTLVNSAAESITRTKASDLMGRQIWEVFPQAREGLEPVFQDAAASRQPRTTTYFLRGRRLWLDVKVYPSPDGLAVFLRDITVRVRLERSARHREAKLAEQGRQLDSLNLGLQTTLAQRQRLLDATYDFVCTIGRDGRLVEVGRRAQDIMGYAASELVGQDSMSLIHPDDREQTLAAQRELRGSTNSVSVRNRHIHKDGSTVVLEWTVSWSAPDAVYYANARDMTAALEAEEKLRRKQRLEAVGRLTGGVAHDFNNLLAVVLGHAEEIALQTDKPELKALATVLIEAAERGGELTNRLLAFSRQQPLRPTLIDLTEVLPEIIDFASRLLGGRVTLRLMVEPRLPSVFIDRTQLETALLNVFINASEAMPKGGAVTVTAARRGVDDNGAVALGEIQISVADTGTGIDEGVLTRVFEPYFTTKEPGTHSGLGLSMVYGFMAQSQGRASISSTPGTGTTVTLVLPAASQTPQPAAPTTTSVRDMGSRQSVLVVEDDPHVRDQVLGLLSQIGCHTYQAPDGPSALALAETLPPVDILLTDIVMPGGMTGTELAKQLVTRWPSMKVVLTSGYCGDGAGLDDLGTGDTPLLRKPYRRDLLVRALRPTLGDGRDQAFEPVR